MLAGKSIVELATELSAGVITADAINEELGGGILSAVLSVAGAGVAGYATKGLLDILDEETGIVSDLGSLVDDVIDLI